MGFAGLGADGKALIDKTRLYAENFRLQYTENPLLRDLATSIAGKSGEEGGG